MQVRRNMLLPSGVSCRHKDAWEDKLLNSWTDSLNQQTDCWCRIYHINIIYNNNFVHSKYTGGCWWGGVGSGWEGGRCPEVELPGLRHQRGCWSGSTGRQQKCRANEQNQCAAEAANKQRSPGTLSHFRQIQCPQCGTCSAQDESHKTKLSLYFQESHREICRGAFGCVTSCCQSSSLLTTAFESAGLANRFLLPM